MEAIILAGGFGTRLQSVVNDVPKPMAPIGKKPFLEYLMAYLASHDIKHFILSVGYLHEKIISHFGDFYQNIPITYIIEKEALGTGGAIKLALANTQNDTSLVYNGDTFFRLSPKDLFHFHQESNADVSVALKKMDRPHRYGTINMLGNKVVNFFEKRIDLKDGLINCGVYCINKNIFYSSTLKNKFSFEKDFLENQLSKKNICGFTHNEYFIDIGIPKDYEKAQSELSQHTT
tara:strand:+ start:746 stop:1444 length:699 start_codon:yes stop_codon:yes gene_type:complete